MLPNPAISLGNPRFHRPTTSPAMTGVSLFSPGTLRDFRYLDHPTLPLSFQHLMISHTYGAGTSDAIHLCKMTPLYVFFYVFGQAVIRPYSKAEWLCSQAGWTHLTSVYPRVTQ